ncbi:hypothetical protein [Leptospira noguchii]|uniref:hypothetical protein n=1 Tax=Leptospira noguchii TaxID=28182 RepID=UPI001E65C14F|nr:hypothetical protein [Leptospira noguchii]
MLRSIVSSIEFEKFQRNWSEKNSMKRFLRKRFRSRAILTMKFASCDDDPGNSVNAYLWVGVQGVVAPEFIIRPNFLTSNSRYLM